MHSPKYILKNKYHERNVERNYEYHQKNLVNIQSKSTVELTTKKETEIIDQQRRRQKNQLNATKFKSNELGKERSFENDSLVHKMVLVNASQSKILSSLSSDQIKSQVFQPKSLVIQTQKREDSRIMEENLKLAKRMINLPPVISTQNLSKNFQKHQSQNSPINKQIGELSLLKKYHKLTPLTAVPKPVNKFSVYIDVLNDLTNNQFDNSKSQVTFPVIEQKINRNTLLCLIQIQNVKVFNNYDLTNPKIPPQFFWEVRYRKKSICMTIPKSYPVACNDLVDFVFQQNSVDQIQLILWKVKNYDEVYIGQIELTPDDFEDTEVVQDYKNKLIKEKIVEKEMFKRVNDCSAFLGNMTIKLIVFCASNIPQNRHSGIPGSPTDPEIKRLHELITQAKLTEYEWQISQDEDFIIVMMEEALKDGAPNQEEKTDEVENEISARIEIYSSKADKIADIEMIQGPHGRIISIKLRKRMNKEELQAIQELLQGLDSNQNLTDVHKKIHDLGLRSRITKKHFEDGIKDANCTYNQLLLQKKDDLELSLMGLMLLEDDKSGCQYPAILEVFNKMDLMQENDQVLSDFARNLFNNLSLHLRKNKLMKATIEFVKSLQNYPEIGLVILQFSQSGQAEPFLSEFNLDNYEHLMLLGKVIKLAKRHLPASSETVMIFQEFYNTGKVNTYFKVPVLPKRLNIMAKQDLLILSDLDSNIMHEIIRRKRYKLLTRALPVAADFCFQKDCSGISPFMNLAEKASFELILQMTDLFGSFDKVEDKILDDNYLYKCQNSTGKNLIHMLLMNKDPAQGSLMNVMMTLLNLLDEEHRKEFLIQRCGDFSPLALYLERIYWKLKKNKKILKEMPQVTEIVVELSKDLSHTYDCEILKLVASFASLPSFDKSYKSLVNTTFAKYIPDFQDYYYNGSLLGKLIAKLDEVFQDDLEKIITWIDWLGFTPLFPDWAPRQSYLIGCLLNNGCFNKVQKIIDSIKLDTFIQQIEDYELQSAFEESIEEFLPKDAEAPQVEQNAEEQAPEQKPTRAEILQQLNGEIFKQMMEEKLFNQQTSLQLLIYLLKEVLEMNEKLYQNQRAVLLASLQAKIRSIVTEYPKLLYQPVIGPAFLKKKKIFKKGEDQFEEHQFETVLNQLFWLKQEAIIPKMLIPNEICEHECYLILIVKNAIEQNSPGFFESEIFGQINKAISQVTRGNILRQLIGKNWPSGVERFFSPLESIETKNILMNQYEDPILNQFFLLQFIKNISSTISERYDLSQQLYNIINNGILWDKTFNRKRFAQEFIANELGQNVLEFLQIFTAKKLKKMEERGQVFTTGLQNVICFSSFMTSYILKSQPNSKGLYAGISLQYVISFFRQNPHLINQQTKVKLYYHFAMQQNLVALNLVSMLLDQDVNRRLPLQVCPYQNKFHSSYFNQNVNWAIALPTRLLVQKLNDCKDVLIPDDMERLCYVFSINGLSERLKLVLDKVKNQEVLLYSLAEATRLQQSINFNSYAKDKNKNILYNLPKSFDIINPKSYWSYKSFQQHIDSNIKTGNFPRPAEPWPKQRDLASLVSTEKGKSLPLSKWFAFANDKYQNPLTWIVKQKMSQNSYNQLKPQMCLSSIQEKSLYKAEYQSSLRRTFLNQNIKCAFYQQEEQDQHDFVKTIDLIIEQLVKNKSLPDLEQKEVEGEDIVRINDVIFTMFTDLPSCVGNHEKLCELIDKSQVPERSMLLGIEQLVNLFASFAKQKKSDYFTKLSGDLLNRAVPFLKKNFNSKLLQGLASDEFIFGNILLKVNEVLKYERHYFEPTISQKFMIEVILLMDQNFSILELNSLAVTKKDPQLMNALALLLLKQKSQDKRVISFLQKHLSKKQFFTIGKGLSRKKDAGQDEQAFQIKLTRKKEKKDDANKPELVQAEDKRDEARDPDQEISEQNAPGELQALDRSETPESQGKDVKLSDIKESLAEQASNLIEDLGWRTNLLVDLDSQPFIIFKPTYQSIKIHATNSDYITMLAKQGVSCILDQTPVQYYFAKPLPIHHPQTGYFYYQRRKANLLVRVTKFWMLINEKQNKDYQSDTLSQLEFLLLKGADYLLANYFLASLKPKGPLSEEQKKRLLGLALKGGNLNTISIVFDDLLAQKGQELKLFIMKQNLLSRMLDSGNHQLLLWFLRKKLKSIENFSSDEILEMLQVSNESLLSQGGLVEDQPGYVKIQEVFHKNMSIFYKEFFVDYLLKNVCKNSQADYIKLIGNLLNQNVKSSNQSLFEIAYEELFFDPIQTVCQYGIEIKNFDLGCRMKMPEQEEDAQERELTLKVSLACQTGQTLENLLRQDNFQQMPILQSCLRLYKLCKVQPFVCPSLDRLGLLETSIFLSPLIKTLGSHLQMYHFTRGVSSLGDVAKLVISLACGYFSFENYHILFYKIEEQKLEFPTIFFLLHLIGFDKALNYPITIEKFCEKNNYLKTHKIYTQIWKNKEALESLNVLSNENLQDGFKQKIAKPEKEDIMSLITLEAKFNANYMIEYLAINDPTFFYRQPYNEQPMFGFNYLVHDQKLLMIVLRSAAERGGSELIDDFIKKSVEQMITLDTTQSQPDSQPDEGEDKVYIIPESTTLLRNYYNALIAIIMLNPQKFQKLIHQQLTQVPTCNKVFQANQEATLITQILLCSYSIYTTLTEYSFNLKNLMEMLHKSATYNLLCENKISGDLGINITDEKQFLDAVKFMIEIILKRLNVKVLFQQETFTKIVSQTAKQSQIVHNDKWFKGFALIKVLSDIGNEIEHLSEELINVRPWPIQELEFRVELLPGEQAAKQSLMLLQQQNIDNDERAYKFLFKLPIGLIKNESNSYIFYYPSPQIQQAQIEAAKLQLLNVYMDKFFKNDLISIANNFSKGCTYFKEYLALSQEQVKKKLPEQVRSELDGKKRSDLSSKLTRYEDFSLHHFRILENEQPNFGYKAKSTQKMNQTEKKNQEGEKNFKLYYGMYPEWSDWASSYYEYIQRVFEMNHTLKINWEGISGENIFKVYNRMLGIQQGSSQGPFFGLYHVHENIPYSFADNSNEAQIPPLWTQLKTNQIQSVVYMEQTFELPTSNYQMRQRKTNLKLRMESEVAFPEFFFEYIQKFYEFHYTIQVMSGQEIAKRVKPLNILSAAVFDLYNLSAVTADKFRLDKEGKDFSEAFAYNVTWPISVGEEEYVQADEFHPIVLITQLKQRFSQFGYPECNILSFTETLFLKLASIYEKANRPIKLYHVVDLALQWNMILGIYRYILELLEANEFSVQQLFKAIYLECNEIDPKKAYDSKNLTSYLEGLDLIFSRMGPANVYIHQGVLVIRLNIATVRTDIQPIEALLHTNMKLKESTGSSILFQENTEIRSYLNSIITKESLMKQLLQKK